MTYFKRFTVIMLVVAMILGTAGIAAAAPADTVGLPCEDAVEYLMDLGVVAGYPDGTYQPARTLTRAEVAKIIVLTKLGDEGEALAGYLKGATSFSDVPADHWASGYIKLAQNLGIVGGYPDGTYKPGNPVTHIELVKMLVLAAGLTPGAGTWPTNYLTVGLAEGIVLTGVGADEPLTRCEMAQMVAHTIANVENPATGLTLAQSVFGESMVATITLVPATKTVGIGGAVQFVATAKDADGATLTDVSITYTTNDPAKSAINSTGLFVASAGGTYTVTATAGAATGTATVAVFGAATALRATPTTTTVPANGETIVEIKIELIDANGIVVADDSETEVEWDYTADGDNDATDFDSKNDADDGTFENGVCIFEVWATENADVTDILEFHVEDHDTDIINEDIEVVEVEITTVEQVATSLELDTYIEDGLMANQIEESYIWATVLDQAGEGMLTGTYELTFSITGKGTLEGDTEDVTKVTGYDLDYDYAHATVDVASVKGDPGSFTLTVTGEGLASDSITINTYIAGSPVALKAIVEEGTAEAGEEELEVTIMLVDKWGHPTVSADGVWLVFTYDDDAYFEHDGGVSLDTEMYFHLDPDMARRTYTFAGEYAGTWTIEVGDADDDYTATSFDVTVTAGDPVDISYEPDEFDDTDLLLPITNPKATFTIQLLDEYGNKVAKADEEIDVWVYGARPVKINGDTVDPEAADEDDRYATVETDATGKAVVMFEAPPYVETETGYWMDFSYNGADWEDEFGYEHMSTIYVTDILPGEIGFDIENWQDENISTVTADWTGEPDDEGNNYVFVTVMVSDTNDNWLYDVPTLLEITFSNDGENVQDVWYLNGDWESADEDDGVYTGWTGNSTYANDLCFVFAGAKAGSFTITAKAVQTWTGVSATKSFRTKVGTEVVDVLIFNTDGTLADDVDVEADEPIALKISPVDNGGNVMVAPEDMEVPLEPVGGEYRLTASGTAIPSVTIGAGKTYKTIYFVAYEDADEVNLSNDPIWPPFE